MEVTRKQTHTFSRLFDIVAYQAGMYPNSEAINVWTGDVWKHYSIANLQIDIDKVSGWLLRTGLESGDKVILVPHMGNYEWMVIDFACQQIGAVTVPVHPTSASREKETIIKETEVKIHISADASLCKQFNDAVSISGLTAKAFHLQPDEDGYFAIANLPGLSPQEVQELIRRKDSVAETDLATILYTSGSTGVPKGVMLTHQNILHNIRAILTLFPLRPRDRVLSFLPFSHILERATCYAYLAFGVSLYFSHRKESFTVDFKSVRPICCTCVPRVLEKMYDFMQEQTLHKHWLTRFIVRWAISVGRKDASQESINPWTAIKLVIARTLVLRQWKKGLGGKIKYMAVGAASLRPDIGRLFNAAGIRVVEGYGMTETAPLISMNRYEPGLNRFGTVGIAIPGIEIQIDAPNEDGEGEILVKGPNVMKGYFKKPEITEAVFTLDGWFRTGDVGKIVHKRFLQITDRKKDIFKTSSGKYIAPQVLQNHFTQSPFIQRCLIVGFQRPFVTALIVPHFDILESWCADHAVHWTAPAFMVHNIKVRARIKEEIEKLNESLPNHERVRDFVLCDKEWTVEDGEITNTLKPVRHLLLENYEKEINNMYSE